jgi:hypothetical protein
MTFLQKTDAETGIYSAEGWDRVLSGWEVVRDNSVAHAGSWSWIVAGDGNIKGSGWILPSYVSGRWFLIRFWVRIGALPTSVQALGLSPSNGSSTIADLTLNTDGTLQIASGANFPITRSAALTAGAWNKLEFAGRFEASSTYNWLNGIWRLNNVEFQRFCGRPQKGAINKVYANTGGSGVRVNVDDMVLNDDTGTTANWWNDGAKPLSTGKTKPSVRSVGTTVTNTVASNSIVVNAPSSIVDGDTLVMVVESSTGNPGTITFPSGWVQRTLVSPSAGGNILVATKVATGSEPSTYTVSWASVAVRGHSVCYALAGSSSSPTIDAQSLSVAISNTEANFMLPALDLSEGDALILQVASMTEASPTKAFINPAWWSNSTSVADTTNGQALACGFFGQTDGGLTATGLMSTTSNITGAASVAAVAFRSAPVSANKFMAVA